MISRPTSSLTFSSGLALSATLCMCLASGCAVLRDPFLPRDSDYARSLALSRLREVPAADYAANVAPPVDLNDRQTVINAVTANRMAFVARERVDLTIEECRRSAIENNLDLKVAIIDPAIARETVTEEDNKFNSLFTLDARYSDSRQSTGSRVSSEGTKRLSIEPGIRIPSRTGTTIDVVPLRFERTELESEFAQQPQFLSLGPSVSISQPLLRGAGRRVNMAALRIAGYNVQAAELRTKLELVRQLSDVDRAYWRLYGARAALDVRVQQFELAQAQLEKARRRLNEGLSPQVEVDRALSGVAQRLEGMLLAQNDVLSRQRELKRIINKPDLPIDTETLVVPQSPPDPVEYIFDREQLQAQAVANRAELMELEVQLAADAARVLLERDGTLPDVRFLASYGFSGLDEHLGSAVDSMFDQQSRAWSVGASVSAPLDNEEARARLRRALLTRVQRLASKDAREQTVRVEVLAAIDSMSTSWQRILAARQAALTAAVALDSEQRQFDLGRVTSTDVLDQASVVAEAQLAEVNALADYQLAQIDLAVATGTLMGAAKVDLSKTPQVNINDVDPSEDVPGQLDAPQR
ncbi:MAG TPA: TolC family protein [Phycisphaerales bacterium]|nr:TolC family protein [Phycisphaerales bacterium]